MQNTIKKLALLLILVFALAYSSSALYEDGNIWYKFDEGSGSKLIDWWGTGANANNATVSGMTWITSKPAYSGNVYSGKFDGLNDIARSVNTECLYVNKNFSISFWANSTTTTNQWIVASSTKLGYYSRNYIYIADSSSSCGNDKLEVGVEGYDVGGDNRNKISFCAPTSYMTSNRFHMFTLVYDTTANKCYWYANTTKTEIVTFLSSTSCNLAYTNDLNINCNASMDNGKWNIGSRDTAVYYKANVDNFMLFKDRALTDAEIATLYTYGSLSGTLNSTIRLMDSSNSTPIISFTVNITNSTNPAGKILSTTSGFISYYISNQPQNIKIYNINGNSFYNRTYLNWNSSNSIELTAVLATTKVTAKRETTGTEISTFSITLSNATFSKTYNTTDGTILFNAVVNKTYNISISATGYFNNNGSFTRGNSFYTYNFNMSPSNQINFNFLNESNLQTVKNVTFKIFASGFSYEGNTGSGNTKYVTGLPNGICEVIFGYGTGGYSQRSIYYNIPLTDITMINTTLLVLSSSSSTLFERTAYDQNNIPYYGGYLELQRAYVSPTNGSYTYKTVQISKIDSIGNAYFNAILNTQQYRIRFLNSELNLIDTKNSNYLVDTTSDIIVDTASDIMQTYFDSQSVSTSLTYNNVTQYFVFDYTDSGSVTSQCCLEYVYTYGGNVSTQQSCSVSKSTTLTLFANMSLDGTFMANAYCYINGNKYVFDTDTESFFNIFSFKGYRFFGVFVFILGTILAMTVGIATKNFISAILIQLFFIFIVGTSYLSLTPILAVSAFFFVVFGVVVLFLVYKS